MKKLKEDLTNINNKIRDLEIQIEKSNQKAEDNVKPLKTELAKIKKEKSQHAYKGNFNSVEICRRKEENLKFKINAQWNESMLLKNDLVKLKDQKQVLESQIKLKKDQIKRKNELLALMDKVLDNYEKSQNIIQAAVDSNISPDSVEQWYEWGENNFSEAYAYFYKKIIEINNQFKAKEVLQLKAKMDKVIDAYNKTKSLKKASKIADVSYDTVQYWYKWGSMGFGEENIYFFKNIDI